MFNDKLIKDFLLGKEVEGKKLSKIWKYTNEEIENDHRFIQWIFPLDTISRHVIGAPYIQDMDFFKENPKEYERIKQNMIDGSLDLMLHYYGFEIKDLEMDIPNNCIKVHIGLTDNPNLDWLTPHNHNYLRITRILKSLILFDLRPFAQGFLDALLDLNKDKDIIPADSIKHWQNALKN